MTNKEVKDFLNKGYQVKNQTQLKRRRIEDWRRVAESITATIKPVAAFSSMPSNKVEDCVCNIIELQEEIQEEINSLAQVERDIESVIKQGPLDDTDRLIMEARYLNYMKWEEIAVALNYAYRWVLRRHGRAIRQLAENWPL